MRNAVICNHPHPTAVSSDGTLMSRTGLMQPFLSACDSPAVLLLVLLQTGSVPA